MIRGCMNADEYASNRLMNRTGVLAAVEGIVFADSSSAVTAPVEVRDICCLP